MKIRSSKGKNHIRGNTNKYWIQNTKSVGEKRIEQYLNQNKIFHLMFARFNDCINPLTGQNLVFDFFLPNHKIVIEYDGEQHDMYIKKFHGDKKLNKFGKQQEKDKIKDKYSKKKGFKMIRIKYNQWDNIEKILETEIK